MDAKYYSKHPKENNYRISIASRNLGALDYKAVSDHFWITGGWNGPA